MRNLLFIVALSVLAACPNPKPHASTAQEFCERLYTATLDYMARCSPEMLPASREDLLVRLRGYCDSDHYRAAQAGISAGRLEIDTAKVDRCIAVLTGSSCEPNWTQVDCSGDLLVGKVDGPGPCYVDEECASGVCLWTNGCPGTCEPLRKAGEPCGRSRNGESLCDKRTTKCDRASGLCVALLPDDACATDIDCVAGQFCKGSATAGSCKPLGVVDCRCASRGSAGAECSTDFACQPGLYCDGTTCRALGKSGESCRFGPTCELPFTCLRSPDLVNGVCGAPRAEGEDCLSYSDCAPNWTCRGADLAAQPAVKGKCGPFGSLNEPCGTSGINDCGVGLSCRSGSCQNRPVAGEACSIGFVDGNDCFGGELICIPSTPVDAHGTCGPLPPVGDICSSTCAAGAYCSISDRCVAQVNAGESCKRSEECLSGVCGSDGRCAPICTP